MGEHVLLIVKYLCLGLLQGFTEPIPISSSGHLVIAQQLFGLQIEGLSFEVFVNFASLIAVFIIFWDDIARIASNAIRYMTTREQAVKGEFLFAVYVIIGTIPAAVIGILFEDVIASVFKGIKVVGVTLLITGFALWLIRNLEGFKGEKGMSVKDALIVGLAQAIALIPGVSRSGATIVGALALGIERKTALRYSFLLYIPVSFGGMILAANDIVSDPMLKSLAIPYAVAFIASLIATYISLKWFINIMQSGKLGYFSIYCWIVGTLVVLFL